MFILKSIFSKRYVIWSRYPNITKKKSTNKKSLVKIVIVYKKKHEPSSNYAYIKHVF